MLWRNFPAWREEHGDTLGICLDGEHLAAFQVYAYELRGDTITLLGRSGPYYDRCCVEATCPSRIHWKNHRPFTFYLDDEMPWDDGDCYPGTIDFSRI